MRPLIAVIDYGMGNLRSVQKALEHAGADARVTDSPEVVRKAQGVVLPGVGAFGEAVRRLKAKRLWNALREIVSSDKPFLGICLGYQLLFEKSEENPGARGLGLFKGPVRRFRFPKASSHKVPHMGWNTLALKRPARSACLKGIGRKDYFYFVHSFYPAPRDRSLIAGLTSYGRTFASAVARGNLFACQFHPEKSGRPGQRILKNFVQGVNPC
ncbi:MAG: imidazole glycerol phosphate synthase, glutamine amidotransferase subunit [Elusimicrobia bacterium RIFCSPLOWO2_01_FULL_59_12]|nr:MAG: imidazole glycerol phosphate synthase, glutamine amidotransferase subunit [Elusimicrobia bacterium RIFCSPLOWO2_01_FULL_59_12]